MRILHFTYNTSGGAGKVAKRFHQLLRKHGFESALVNTEENNSKEGIYSIPSLDQAPRKLINQLRYYSFRLSIRLRYPKKYIYHFNYNYNYRGLTSSEIIKALPFKPDIIMLHWISDFILPQHIEDLQKH